MAPTYPSDSSVTQSLGANLSTDAQQDQKSAQDQKSEHETKTIQETEIEQSSSVEQNSFFDFLPTMEELKTRSQSAVATLSSISKVKIIFGASLLSYAAILYSIHKSSSPAKQNNGWGSWRRELSFDELLAIPQKKIGEEITMAAQRKYLNPSNPADPVTPLVTFCHDVDEEIRNLQKYLSYSKWLRKIYLHKIFFLKDCDLLNANERINRLIYLKNTFITWSAQQNLERLTQDQGTNFNVN